MTSDQIPLLPGRLGDPNLKLGDDHRIDPRIRRLIAGADGAVMPSLEVDATSPIEDILQFIAEMEAIRLAEFEGREDVLGRSVAGMEPVEGVVSSVERIQGVDGNEIDLFIHRPTETVGLLPAVVHLHGGGMVMLVADSAIYARWRDELASRDLVVVGVEFRNGGGKQGPHPFPAGLNDCLSAVRWIDDNAARLGVSGIVLSGESGGGNLSIATALKARREGLGALIDGVYALCPYISGAYATPAPELVSLFENDGLPVPRSLMATLARAYDPDGAHDDDALAWPYRAARGDLTGLPPHVISVNEIDPMRDEGIAYFRKLREAGVEARCRTVNGTVHAGETYYIEAIPDIAAETIDDIARFAHALSAPTAADAREEMG